MKANYQILEGSDQKYIIGESSDILVRANGDISKFNGIKIDKNLIDQSNYTDVSGSTIVTLKKTFLDTLTPGTHTMTFIYTDGEVSTEFEIAKIEQAPTQQSTIDTTTTNTNTVASNPNNPKISDSIFFWSILLASLIFIFITIKKLKTKK